MIAAFIIGALGSAASVSSFMPPPNVRQSEIDQYFHCLAFNGKDRANLVLTTKEAIGPKILSYVVIADCYPVNWLSKRRVAFNTYYFAGKLAQFLIIIGDRSKMMPDRIGSKPQTSRPSFFDAKDPDDLVAEKVRLASACVVETNARVAYDFVLAKNAPDSASNLSEIAKSCPDGELLTQMPHEAMLSAIALSYYRLEMAATVAAGGPDA